jgi:hypothetical protein
VSSHGNRAIASHCLVLDVYSDCTIPAFRSPSIGESVTSGTCFSIGNEDGAPIEELFGILIKIPPY